MQSTPVGSHQSIGAAERYHDIVAGYVRTYAAQVLEYAGFDIEPHTRLFAWLLRHAGYIVSTHHVQASGVTSHFMLRGCENRFPLAMFGEQVLMKVSDDALQSKAKPRWIKVVWAGVHAENNSHIGLDKNGYITCRDCRRLSGAEQWNKQLLAECAGTPWSRHEGGATDKRFVERSPAIPVTHIPPPDGTPVPRSAEVGQAGDTTPRVPPSPMSEDSPIPSLPEPTDMDSTTPRKREASTTLENLELQLTSPERGPTGSTSSEAQLTRQAAWQPQGEGPAKKWRQIGGADIAHIQIFLLDEVRDVCPSPSAYEMNAVEEYAESVAILDEQVQWENRCDEIRKLEDFKAFEAVPASTLPDGVRLFDQWFVLMVFKMQCSYNIKHAEIVDMPQSLSR